MGLFPLVICKEKQAMSNLDVTHVPLDRLVKNLIDKWEMASPILLHYLLEDAQEKYAQLSEHDKSAFQNEFMKQTGINLLDQQILAEVRKEYHELMNYSGAMRVL
jgi:hypothetical protein